MKAKIIAVIIIFNSVQANSHIRRILKVCKRLKNSVTYQCDLQFYDPNIKRVAALWRLSALMMHLEFSSWPVCIHDLIAL